MGDSSEASAARHQPKDLLGQRAGEYVQIWEAATAKMMTGSYRSEDFIEDWFGWWGRAARDVTAAATLGFTTVTQDIGTTNDERGPGDEVGT